MSEKRLRLEPRTYNLTRNYTTKRSNKGSHETSQRKKRITPQPPTIAYVLDSGAYTVKAGPSTADTPYEIPNCIMKAKSERKRPFIGDQIEECRDLSGLFYLLPCEKGYITKWDVQKPIWDYVFQKSPLLADKPLIMTQPQMNFRSIQECMDEIFYEEYDVKSMYRTNTTDLIQYEYVKKVNRKEVDCIIVDTGYSFTHIVPYVKGLKYFPGIKRIDVGGKLLTNHLKDIISYRQLHVMEETHVINQVKEDTCFVSQDILKDMNTASLSDENNTIVKNYVLPDFNNIRRGYIHDPSKDTKEILEGYQILRLNNERFTVPELLLHPSNIGMDEKGIAETIVSSILECPKDKHTLLAHNIVLAGGNANFPGLTERVKKDVEALSPSHWKIRVHKPENPVNFAWMGGKSLASNPYLHSVLVTKQEYEEHGSNYTYKKFNNINRMKKKRKSEVVQEEKIDEPDVENCYSHLCGNGRLVNQIQNHLDVQEDNLHKSDLYTNMKSEVIKVNPKRSSWNDSVSHRLLPKIETEVNSVSTNTDHENENEIMSNIIPETLPTSNTQLPQVPNENYPNPDQTVFVLKRQQVILPLFIKTKSKKETFVRRHTF